MNIFRSLCSIYILCSVDFWYLLRTFLLFSLLQRSKFLDSAVIPERNVLLIGGQIVFQNRGGRVAFLLESQSEYFK